MSTLIGFGDPEAGKKVGVIGNSFISIADSINKISDLKSIFSSGGLIASGNIVGAIMNIVGLFGDSGPTPDEMILEEIGALKKMIQTLGEQMHDRFDRVDAQLVQIYDHFSREFDGVNFRLGVLQSQVTTLQNLTLGLRTAIARVEIRMQLLFQAQEARRFTGLLLELEEYEANVLPMSSETFTRLVRGFYQVATSNSVDEIASPVRPEPLRVAATIASQLTGTNDNLTANLNYLNTVVLENGWMSGPGLANAFGTLIPSSSEWKSGADGIMRLFTRWPQIARSNPFYLTDRLNGVINSGETLRTALERITLLRSGNQWQTNALWGHLIQNYRSKAAQFLTELHKFELTQLTNLVAGADTSRQPYMNQLDLWGPLDQGTAYLPRTFSQNVPPLNSGNAVGGPMLSPPLQPETLLAAAPGIAFSGLLNIAACSWDYRNVDFLNDRSRGVGYRLVGGFSDTWYMGTLREARYEIDLHLLVVATNGYTFSNLDFTWQYVHSKYHIHGFTTPDGYFGRFGPEPTYWNSTRTVPYYFNSSSSVGWPNWSTIIGDFWNGDWEPVRSSDRVTSVHKISSVRTNFSNVAIVSQRPAPSGEQLFQRSIEDRLRSLQTSYLSAVTDELLIPGTSLGNAAQALLGARELLRVFVELGLPVSYQQSDVLRSLFTGSEKLPDLSVLLSLCDEGLLRSQFAATHTERPDFAGILNGRISALETVINDRLAEIQATGEAEIIPLVADTLRELKFTQQSTLRPVPPYLTLQSVAPDHAMLLLLGESYVPYELQWSSNLVHWSTVQEGYLDGAFIPINSTSAPTGFLRVKGP